MSQGREDRTKRAAHPERLGRYEILLPIASGGMGVVYLARARGAGGFERDVALKLLHKSLGHDDFLAAELVEEAKLTVRIRHPNVVQVFDVEEDPFGVFMSMEYVEGSALGGLLRAAREEGSRVPPEVGLRILLDALAGLHAAHELACDDGRPLGLVHRDFSPQNILVGIDGTTRLADFGIAKAAGRAGHTATGAIKGKLAYLAPEQIRGSRLDRRCDVWAAGAVAWEIFAGRPLYQGSDDIALMYQIAHVPAPRLRSVGVDVSIELDEAIARALTLAPEARCPSAAAFARTLESAGLEPAAQDEVAACVRRFAGAELAARKGKIVEILEHRRQNARGTSPETSPADPSTAPTARAMTASVRSGNAPEPRGLGARATGIAATLGVAFFVAFGLWAALRPTSPTTAPGGSDLSTSPPLATLPPPPDLPAASGAPSLSATGEPAPPLATASAIAPATSAPGQAPLADLPAAKATGSSRLAPKPTGASPAHATSSRKPGGPLPLADNPYGKK